MTRRTLRFGDLRIRVASADPRDLAWLREFLGPAVAGGADGAADCVVRLTVDADRHARLSAAARAARRRPAACFALDTAMIRLPAWSSGPRERTIHDAEYACFYIVRGGGAEVEILARQPDRWRGRIPLMRVVRELAMNHAVARGGLLVHAAALDLGARGIVVAGPRRAGKTTLLTWLLGEPDARYIANDRVVIGCGTRGFLIRGVPTIVTLRAAMLRRFPGLRRRLARSGYNPCLSLREVRAAGPGSIATDEQGRLHLSPAQYRELLATRGAGGGRLHVLVFPRLTHRRGGLEVRRLTAAAAARRLRAALFRAAFRRKGSDVFAPFRAAAPEGASALVHRLAARVPCFECRVGADAYRGRRGVASLRGAAR